MILKKQQWQLSETTNKNSPKMDLYRWKNIYLIISRVDYQTRIDLNLIYPMASEIEISSPVKSNYENCRNGYDAGNRIVSKLSKIPIPNFDSINWKNLIKIVLKFHVPILNCFREIRRQRVTVGQVHCFNWFIKLVLKCLWRFITNFPFFI